MNIDKSCYNSSCKPAATERRSKKLTDFTDATESLTRIFLTFVFDANNMQTESRENPSTIPLVLLRYN